MQDLSGFSVPKGLQGGSVSKTQLWQAVQVTTSVWSPQALYRWWAFLLRLFGTGIGKSVVIRPSIEIIYPQKLTLGDYAWIGDEVNSYTLGEITIGAYSMISQRSYLCAGSHDHASQHFTINATPIVIDEKRWLATDVFIAPGITIGNNTVMGVRSSVFKLLPVNVVCRGNPAVVIRERVETK